MTAQHVGDKAGGAVFTADIGIGRWRGAGEPEDEGEIFFAFTELLTQVGFTFFEIGDQRLATISAWPRSSTLKMRAKSLIS